MREQDGPHAGRVQRPAQHWTAIGGGYATKIWAVPLAGCLLLIPAMARGGGGLGGGFHGGGGFRGGEFRGINFSSALGIEVGFTLTHTVTPTFTAATPTITATPIILIPIRVPTRVV